jgi:hypothetical protein
LLAIIMISQCCKCNADTILRHQIAIIEKIKVGERIIRALVEPGAVTKVKVVAEGLTISVEVTTGLEFVAARTNKGALKTWASIDMAAKWVHGLGLGTIQLDITRWQPGQEKLKA